MLFVLYFKIKKVNFFKIRPGFTRLNLPFFATDDEINYIFDAVDFIATHGWKSLPLVSRLTCIL